MVRHTLKILQNLVQDFQSVFDHFGTLCIKGLKANLRQFNISYKIKGTHTNFIFNFSIIYQYINISSKISNHITYLTYMIYYICYFDIIDIIDNFYIFDVIDRVWQVISKVIYTIYNDMILLSNTKKLNKIHVLDNNVTQLTHIPIKHLKLSEQVFSLFQYSERVFLQIFYKTGIFKNFAKFMGKHLRCSLSLIKLQAFCCNFIKKRLQRSCLLVNFEKFLKGPFLQKTSWWLILNMNM